MCGQLLLTRAVLRSQLTEGEGVVFEVLLELGQGPVGAVCSRRVSLSLQGFRERNGPLVDSLFRAGKVERLDATHLLLFRSCSSAPASMRMKRN